MRDKGIVMLVAYAFASREKSQEPNPCNRRLAEETRRVAYKLHDEGYHVVVVAQWEIALALRSQGFWIGSLHSVEAHLDGSYLSSEDVWMAARRIAETRKVVAVVAIANPFLHLTSVRSMMRQAGYSVLTEHVGWIGFDASRLNTQWWCRGPLQLVAYSALTLFGYHGHAGRQSA